MQRPLHKYQILRIAAALVLCGAGVASQAGPTLIADMPLITSNEFHAKPNLMFVLDDSGSMASAYMPDDMSDTSSYGYWSAQCNGVAYDPDPNVTYDPPVDDTGASKGNASYSAAWDDGYARSSTTDLSLAATESVGTYTSSSNVAIGNGAKTFVFTGSGFTSTTFAATQTITLYLGGNSNRWMSGKVTSWNSTTKTLVVDVTSNNTSGSTNTGTSWTVTRKIPAFYVKYSGSETRMGWAYTSAGVVSNNFYTQCTTSMSSTSSVFTKVSVLGTSAEAQKYANWYAYYRTRTLLMRTAVGRAFKSLTEDYRVGFSTISDTGATDSNTFHGVGDFTGQQKTDLYKKLYDAPSSGNTPLRAAVSKIGRYYGKRYTGQTDPVQYACQRNYLLLSTDGYWNTGKETSTFGAFDMSGAAVGNQDGREDTPMYDGATTSKVWFRTLYSVGRQGKNGCSSTQYQVTTQPQVSSNNTSWTNNGASTAQCQAGTYIVYGTQTAASLANSSVASTSTPGEALTGGSSNSLADVAEYYYKTDLRDKDLWNNCSSGASGTTQDVCSNVVEAAGRDSAKHQHMTTFTIGLGVSGTLTYDRNYLTQPSGDYAKLVAGTASWPVPTETTNGGDARNIDDLWHAAVNGRGQYYSALNATQLADAIKGVTDAIGEKFGSAAAATTSTLELVSGTDNLVYRASYTTGTWIGDLQAFTLDGNNGTIGTSDEWSAQKKLAGTLYSARKIYYRKPSTSTLALFNWTNLNADGLGGNFTNLCSKASVASQCASLSNPEKTLANTGSNLVDFLRGDRVNEAANSAISTSQALYRPRAAVLGDIINGAPKFVGKPSFSYSDAGYTDFVQTQTKKPRKSMIYVAANDGMLHAFSAADDADGGKELWAFVPTYVMPEMYRLADTSYRSKHRYFVDGAPVTGDIYVNGQWKTILVGGLGKGGRSYYALDITDPDSPEVLWEFTDDNLGMTFGNPVITKNANGTWVVMFASGYNNVSPGDGKGRLFIVNANTGVKEHVDIVTTAGDTTTPAGLAKINGWIDQETDNTTKRVYGGDMLGNLWRFDIDGLIAPKESALLLAQFLDGTKPQPVTMRPRLAQVGDKAVVIVGTGRYLDSGDITDTSTQSLYAVKDSLSSTGLGDVRQNDTMVKQSFDDVPDQSKPASTIGITNKPVSWSINSGWWVDFAHTGERVVTDIALQSGVLAVATAIPSGDACESGGGSWNYFLGVNNGWALENAAGALVNANSLIVGQSFVRMADGKLRLLRQLSDGTTVIADSPAGTSSNIVPQRTSWRELTD